MADDLLTISDIFRELLPALPDLRRHQLTYCLTEYGIEPARRAGIVRLWRRDQIPHIKSALARIAGRREACAHA